MNKEIAPPTAVLPFLAAFVALLAFLALQDTAFLTAGGNFEYPLDDPYIHLAMAEQMRAGGYGVNAGEYAAAASSPLFPVLLMPFADTEWHRYLPFVWNGIGLVLSALLWGRILSQAGYGTSPSGLLFAVLGPLALHFVGVAFTGMEHSLHLAASLGIVAGLLRFVDRGDVGRLLMFSVLLSPLLRPEGLALAGMAVLVVLSYRRLRPATTLLVLGFLPTVLFAVGLTRLGLDPVPSSVTSKIALPHEASGLAGYFLEKAEALISSANATVLVGVLVLAVGKGRRPLVLAVLVAAVAHVFLGRFGWMDRYEVYILGAVAAGLLAAAAHERRLQILVVIPILYAGSVYAPRTLKLYPDTPRAVFLQQGQMARFAKEHLAEPVAVNDLGKVAWQNPDYVLDLWGLANHEARETRLRRLKPGWVDGLTDARDVKFAMIYETWFPGGLGEDWQRLGDLTATGPAYYLGGTKVSFYVTGPQDPAPYVAKIAAWAEGLPEGAVWRFAEGVSP
ncbi:putative membrane protein of unknown function [Candidatus Rhodobacter oscarellae]|uniref:Glycosyltransferase RgtA/B/C/D-like domain-containing protein n=1 Tax=Candidatus Rhodobacter oscarellae TaxID=1675527 RepID=A0A0J9E0F5_9RHOB|nr:hypothetical protein [Candidatus Rhodobacter lobularis]KMW56117.1 putative membrane protein of unknown function [Candidatus Rhodobacter lobularis]